MTSADEGTLHGRVLRPPGRGARLVSVDLDRVRALPGVVAAVRDGSVLGVVAEGRRAGRRPRSRDTPERREVDGAGRLPPFDRIPRLAPVAADAGLPRGGRGVARQREPPPVEAEPSATTTVRRVFTRPYLLHAPIGPSAALAVWDGDTLARPVANARRLHAPRVRSRTLSGFPAGVRPRGARSRPRVLRPQRRR